MEGESKKGMLSEESGSELSWLKQVYEICMALSMKTGLIFIFLFAVSTMFDYPIDRQDIYG